MVEIYLANTDNSWFDYLSAQPSVDEVNFWRPNPKPFETIKFGDLLAFRLKSPRNVIGGFGYFTTSSILPIETAWDAFGIKNGVPTLDSLIESIANYSTSKHATPSTFIGCRVLVQPIFFPEGSWLDLPQSWSRQIVSGKRYTTETEEGSDLLKALLEKSGTISMNSAISGFSESPAKFGLPTLVAPRLGQGAFRVAIIESYGRQCALTTGKV